MSYKVDIFLSDEQDSLLQVDTIIFNEGGQVT